MVASLLILGILAAELPELLSLVDNTSNDFVIRKVGRAEYAPPLTAASYISLLPEMKHFGRAACAYGAADFVGAEAISSDLFVLHSVLRR